MKYLAPVLLLFTYITSFGQNVGIGTTSPHPSAAIDITDTNRGLLIPRADTVDVIAPATGLLVYQLSDNGFY